MLRKCVGIHVVLSLGGDGTIVIIIIMIINIKIS